MSVDIEKHDEIKRMLRARKVTFATIAKRLGVSAGAVTMVSQGHRSSIVIAREIAHHLNVTPSDLWPSRFEPREEETE